MDIDIKSMEAEQKRMHKVQAVAEFLLLCFVALTAMIVGAWMFFELKLGYAEIKWAEDGAQRIQQERVYEDPYKERSRREEIVWPKR